MVVGVVVEGGTDEDEEVVEVGVEGALGVRRPLEGFSGD